MKTVRVSSSSFPMVSVLFIVFLVLKLTHVIDWSWWWVTAPLWGTVLLIVLTIVIGIVAALVASGRKR